MVRKKMDGKVKENVVLLYNAQERQNRKEEAEKIWTRKGEMLKKIGEKIKEKNK